MSPSAYALLLGPLGPSQLRVESFRSREAMNDLYQYDVRVSANLPPLVFERLVLSQRAVFAMRVGGRTRCVHGMVCRVHSEEQRRVFSGEIYPYSIRIVPRMWLATRRRCSQVFQDTDVPTVLSDVLARVDVRADFNVRAMPRCAYLTQYEETDWDLVRRLAAESGIAFHFEQPPSLLADTMLSAISSELGPIGDLAGLAAGFVESELGPTEKVVFHDAATYPPLEDGEPALPFHPTTAGARDQEVVESLVFTRAIRSTTATFRDYDPARPLAALESTLAAEGPPEDPLAALDVVAPTEPADLYF
jgi:uncharacterized protein involved in type VI secretion and phage assembly